MERRGRATSLAPGFRFHPTDVELISYYLKRKICGKPFRFDVISDIDIYKAEPWDLPGFSKLKTRDLEWYFFSSLDKKYGNGSKTNRATTEGYWKTTGKDRPVYHKSRVAGMKKTLVYHRGRAPRGERTNWVMHEYRLVDEELEKAAVAQESFVLCRIFQKSGSGPKNGEHYGAPFIEEEWEDDEVAVTPAESITDDMCASDDAFFNNNDIDQNLKVEPLENSTFSLCLDNENGNTLAMNSIAFTEDTKSLTVVNEETQVGEGMNDVHRFFSLPVEHDRKTVKIEYVPEPNNLVSHDSVSYLPGEQGEENANCSAEEDFFFEANELLAPAEAKSSEFEIHEQYLSCFSSDDNIDQYLSLDTSDLLVGDVSLPDEPFFSKENLAESTSQASTSRQLPGTRSSDSASSSKQVTLASKSETDFDYPFIKQGSYMLGCFPASLGYASDFPTKDMAAHLNAASAHSSEPVRVTAGFMRIQNHFSANDNGIRACVDKTGKVNMVVFFDVSDSVSGELISETLSGKLASAISQVWLFSILWVVVFVISANVESCIYAMS